MPGQPIDWRRAKHPKFEDTPLHEISNRDAADDQQVLEKIAARDKKAREAAYRKLPRALKKRRQIAAFEDANARPDRPDELKLSTILASPRLRKFSFKKVPYLPDSDRSFVCEHLKVRIIVDPKDQGRLPLYRRDRGQKFDWLLVKLPIDIVMKESGFTATLIEEVCSQQAQLREQAPRA